MSAALAITIRVGLFALLLMPLIVTQNETIVPFAIGKVAFSRSLIELLGVLWVALVLLDRSYRPSRSMVLILFGVWVGVAFISAFMGVSFTRSFWSNFERSVGVWDLLHWLLFILVAGTVLRTRQHWDRLLNWNLAVVLVLALIGLAQSADIDLQPVVSASATFPTGRIYGSLGNAAFLGVILAMAIPLAAGFIVRELFQESPRSPPVTDQDRARSNRRQPIAPKLRGPGLRRFYKAAKLTFWLAVIVFGIWALLETGTRGSLLALAVASVSAPLALAIWGNRALKKWAALATAAVIAVAGIVLGLAFLVGSDVPSAVPGPGRIRSFGLDDLPLRERFYFYKAGLSAVQDRPIFGWGVENFSAALEARLDPSYFNQANVTVDRAHNEFVEEITTKGVFGAFSYIGLTGVLFWVIIRRRRTVREDIFAYAVFGSLVAHVVHNQFSFDVPPTLLHWTLLVAYLVWLERADRQQTEDPQAAELSPARRKGLVRRRARIDTHHDAVFLAKGAVVAIAFGLMIASWVNLNYGVFRGAELMRDFKDPGISWTQRLELAQESFDAFPGLANSGREIVFVDIALAWGDLTPEEQAQARSLLDTEIPRALSAEPRDLRIRNRSIVLLQRMTETAEDLDRIEPLLAKLLEIAPSRPQTHQRLAAQQILRGNDREAIKIMEDYIAMVPGSEVYFRTLLGTAKGLLEQSER